MKMAELLFENGADIDMVINEKKGYTILMIFCTVKYKLSKRELDINLSMIKFLIEHGASKSQLSRKGKNIFELAKKHCEHEKVLSILTKTKKIYFHDEMNKVKSTNGSVQIKEKKSLIIQQKDKEEQYCSLGIVQWFTDFFGIKNSN